MAIMLHLELARSNDSIAAKRRNQDRTESTLGRGSGPSLLCLFSADCQTSDLVSFEVSLDPPFMHPLSIPAPLSYLQAD